MVRAITGSLPILILICSLTYTSLGQEIIDPEKAKADADFSIQGEYFGSGALLCGSKSRVGAQVVALGEGEFQVVVYKGGLPGDGWKRGDDCFSISGRRGNGVARLQGDIVSGEVGNGKMTIIGSEGKRRIGLKRVERKSPTLGAKPPDGDAEKVVVLFDGSNVDHFTDATLTDMKTLQAGTTSKSKFEMRSLHLEFRLSYKPKARGQGRSNSGIYIGGCPEIQVLDSFGLEGRKNECGAFYGRREPDVNMCLPPLVWQTFDVEFTPAKHESDKQVGRPLVTVRHNGVVIHQDYELSRGSQGPRGIHLQQHGNRVQYRNIWLVEEE